MLTKFIIPNNKTETLQKIFDIGFSPMFFYELLIRELRTLEIGTGKRLMIKLFLSDFWMSKILDDYN
jgi:hypothetical protein